MKIGDIGMGDSTGVSASLGGEIFSRGKKSWESNIGGGTIAGRAIITRGGEMDLLEKRVAAIVGYRKKMWGMRDDVERLEGGESLRCLDAKLTLEMGQNERKRLGHPVDPVLNVLKDSLPIDKQDNIICCEVCQRAKQTRERLPLSDHISKRLGDLVHLDLWGPYKVTSFEGFSSSSSMSGSNINTADFLVDYENDVDSSDDLVATHNEEVATLEENIFSKGNLDQNPSSSQASKYSHWTDAMNQEMDTLLRNGTWELVELPEDRKAIGSKWIYKIKFRSSSEIDRYKARLVAQDSRYIYLSKMADSTCIYLLNTADSSQSKSDYSLYTKSDKEVFLALLVYVDDIISQFMHSSLSSHLKIAFKILRYLKSCPSLRIHIARTSGMFLNAYSDANWPKCIVTRKPVTGLSYVESLADNEPRLKVGGLMLPSVDSFKSVVKIHNFFTFAFLCSPIVAFLVFMGFCHLTVACGYGIVLLWVVGALRSPSKYLYFHLWSVGSVWYL
ncbi:ribonuclease H-like domain-containing protein [Tanacetum coccineum]